MIYSKAAELLKEHNYTLATKVTNFVQENFPYRTREYEKCTRHLRKLVSPNSAKVSTFIS